MSLTIASPSNMWIGVVVVCDRTQTPLKLESLELHVSYIISCSNEHAYAIFTTIDDYDCKYIPTFQSRIAIREKEPMRLQHISRPPDHGEVTSL